MADSFKRRLAASRGAVTKSIGKLEELHKSSPVDVQQIKALTDNLASQNNRLESLNDDLEKHIDDEDLDAQYEKVEDYRTAVQLCLSVSKSIVLENEVKQRTEKKEQQSLKLPKLTLPQFTGEILEWQEFLETFSITVDKQALSSVEKLQYLKNCLKGEPSQVLTGLPLTNNNYEVAIDLLKERYGSKRRIIRTHVQALISMKQPNQKSYQSLRNFVDSVKKHLRGLTSLNVESENYDIIMCEILLLKLPTDIKHEWAKLTDQNMTLNNLLNIVETEAKHLDIMSIHQTEQTSPSNKLLISEHKSKSLNFSIQEKQLSSKCWFCNKVDHFSYKCPVFSNKCPEDRIKLTKKSNLCINCLKRHYPANCTSTHRCKICKGFHNTLLHIEKGAHDNKQTSHHDTVNVKSTLRKEGQSFQTILPTLFLPIVTKSGLKHVGALVDSGSERSFICSSAVKRLQLTSTKQENIVTQGFSGPDTKENCGVVNISIQSSDSFKTNLSLLVSKNMKEISLPGIYMLNNISSVFPICKRPDVVEIIIGADHYYDVVTGNSHSIDSKLKLLETLVGWALHGLIPTSSPSNQFKILFTTCVSVDNSLDVRKYWDNDLAGIQPQENSCQENVLTKQFDSGIQLKDNRYSVNLPWLPKRTISCNYRNLAYCRLIQTTKKLIKGEEIQSYHAIFTEYLKMDIIERSTNDAKEPGRFIPHHAVIKNSSTTTKMRIVFDASAKDEAGMSLNSCLFEGPNLFPDLIGVLLRFRLYEFALCSDLEKAFLQISINEHDRNFLQFLWFEQINKNNWPNGKVIAYRFKRLPFGLRSSPFILNRVIKYHIETFIEKFPDTVNCLNQNLYVDDLILSCETKEQLSNIKHQSINIFKDISMKMHKTFSNAPDEGMTDTTKILGISWIPSDDYLFIKFEFVQVRTKRQLVSLLCSMFDPLGWFLPITNKLKLLVQRAWQGNFDWDQDLPDEIVSKVEECKHDIEAANSIRISRWMNFNSNCTNIAINAFCDASLQLYSACVYLSFNHSGTTTSQLLCSKSRVAPKERNTIPRLELQAALLSARLVTTIQKQFRNQFSYETNLFSDSQVVLAWINNTNKVNENFIQNRVNEIRELTNTSSWHYISSKENPADIATRSVPSVSWIFGTLWWKGPKMDNVQPFNIQQEACKFEDVTVKNTCIVDPLFNYPRFSNYTKLLKTAFYVFKFLRLTNETFNRSHVESLLIKHVQTETFPSEISNLSKQLSISSKSKLSQLQPFLDNSGILRVSGRLSFSDLSFNAKHPTILPKSHAFTNLLLKAIHESNCHAGVSLMCTISRQSFWILQCRRACKKIVDHCIKCRRFKSKPLQQNFDVLPTDRVQSRILKSFDATGVDYLGPIAILGNQTKLYVLLFTCLQIRAVHLELTTSLSTKDFCNAFTRFISRRGTPSIIRSDNAKTFVSAADKLSTSYNIEWKFNVPRAPWAGGVWERMVRTVKTSLRYIISKIPPTIQEFETHLCHIENIINSRPLTYATGNEELLPLTPQNFLQSSSGLETSVDNQRNSTSIQNALNCSHKVVQSFWKRWKEEYLTLLNKNSKETKISINVGDILMLNEGSKRQYWPLVKVTELLKGRDGKIRSAKVKLKGKFITRPIKLLHPLEL